MATFAMAQRHHVTSFVSESPAVRDSGNGREGQYKNRTGCERVWRLVMPDGLRGFFLCGDTEDTEKTDISTVHMSLFLNCPFNIRQPTKSEVRSD